MSAQLQYKESEQEEVVMYYGGYYGDRVVCCHCGPGGYYTRKLLGFYEKGGDYRSRFRRPINGEVVDVCDSCGMDMAKSVEVVTGMAVVEYIPGSRIF